MLAVTRKLEERIHIDDDIVIRILDIKSKSVKIGIEAPANRVIFRGEIYDEIAAANREMMGADFGTEDVNSFLAKKRKPT